MINKKIYLIPLIIWLSGCASMDTQNEYKKHQVENIKKQKDQKGKYIKVDPSNPELSIPSYKARRDREKIENHYFQKLPGKYVVTKMDMQLTTTYSKRHVLKFQKLKPSKAISWNEEVKGPYGRWNHVYETLKIDRGGISASGANWKVYIEELDTGDFKIKGKNSLDQLIDKKCKTLLECFNLL